MKPLVLTMAEQVTLVLGGHRNVNPGADWAPATTKERP